MITIQFIDFEPEPNSVEGVEAQIASLNSWLSGRPDVNVINIETILIPQSSQEELDPFTGRLLLAEVPQVVRLWYEGER